VVGAAGLAALLLVVLTGTPIGRNLPPATQRLRITLGHSGGDLLSVNVNGVDLCANIFPLYNWSPQILRKQDMKMHAARSIQAIRCAEHATAALRHGRVTSRASKFRVQHASPWVGQLRSKRHRRRSSCESSDQSWVSGTTCNLQSYAVIALLCHVVIPFSKDEHLDLVHLWDFCIPSHHPGEFSIRHHLLSGLQHIDDAEMYGNEEAIGQGIQELIGAGIVKRKDLFIVSKLGNNHHAPDAVLPAVQASLSKLQLEYLDLYHIHW